MIDRRAGKRFSINFSLQNYQKTVEYEDDIHAFIKFFLTLLQSFKANSFTSILLNTPY